MYFKVFLTYALSPTIHLPGRSKSFFVSVAEIRKFMPAPAYFRAIFHQVEKNPTIIDKLIQRLEITIYS